MLQIGIYIFPILDNTVKIVTIHCDFFLKKVPLEVDILELYCRSLTKLLSVVGTELQAQRPAEMNRIISALKENIMDTVIPRYDTLEL